jgi:hypothetical protein
MARAEADGDVDREAGIVMELLVEQAIETIIAFDRILYELIARAYTRELWAAAYIINYGASDDGFEYFLGWLIAQGESVYDEALQDADSLADLAEPDSASECEAMLYVAQYAYERRTGREMPTSHRRRPARDVTSNTDDQVPNICPRLWTKFSA